MSIKKLPRNIFLTINVLIIIGLIVTGYAGHIDPRTIGVASLIGYGLPVFIIANFAMMFLWAVFSWKYVVVPFLGFIICYQPVSLYIPFHTESEVPEGALKVMSYNTWSFGLAEENTSELSKDERIDGIMNFIISEDCDFVCLQESGRYHYVDTKIDSLIRTHYPYVVSVDDHRTTNNVFFSKHPVLWSEMVEYESKGNFTTAYCIDVHGKELLVINCHLETVHFSYFDKDSFSQLVKGKLEKSRRKHTAKHLARRLADSSKTRAAQADAVAAYIEKHKGRSIIVCGDFNDIVNSYTHHTIGKGLTDCYRTTASGPGFSYKRYGMKVRIDNALVTPDITPYNFRISDACRISDHLPLIGYIAL